MASSVVKEAQGCLWCGQIEKPNAYVLPLKNGQRKFCSEACLFEFRKGACSECGDVIPGPQIKATHNSVVKDFCSESCLLKCKKRDEIIDAKSEVPFETNADSLCKSPSIPPVPTSSTYHQHGSGSSPMVLNNSSSFSWEDYLAETNSMAAPHKCFKQVHFR